MAPTTRICIPVCAKDLSTFQSLCKRAVEWADIVELRLDCYKPEDLSTVVSQLNNLSRTVILTFRPSEEGGYQDLSVAARETFWKTQAPRGDAIWWALEADLAHHVSPDWSRTILSHHDFSRVPTDLETIYERLAQSPAGVIKIAVQAHDIVDCIPVFRLIERARSEGREIIAIAMGDAGNTTRILGPSRGAFLTYGSLDEDSATAPGQVNARNLRSLYNIDAVNTETMICGLIGRPVMHSVSPHIHNAAFAHEEVNGVYLPFEVADINAFVKRMVHPRTREMDWNMRGLSITAPHKQSVMECLDWIEPEAAEIGAVNTVVVEKDRLLGYNTDAAGFIEPLLKHIGSLEGRQVAIIGAGGAARAAVWALKRAGARVTVFVRDVSKSNFSCESLVSASFSGYDLVVNATPAAAATKEQLRGAQWVYDLVYNPIETPLIKEAREAGCQTLGGLEMLVAQARVQFELWTGKPADHSIMYDSAAAALGT